MSGIHEVIGKHTISLVLIWVALEAIQSPICPINSSLFQVFDQISPRNVSLVVSELAQQVRMAEAAHEGLGVKHLLFEAVIGNQGPTGDRPRETIKMARVD